ncbi:hypothetical protein E4P29_11245 [Rhodococcus sp. 1R11]|uniref:hypothetical protein n=1 Tax=Rhodococcus sp. 1R11 TaxID=2559614 RepID=UPI0010729DF7|nr:hypothetical protein [Rhodococcus sp. 1R11]TFI43572.1 hypothetical protein E4P29_11245 [Rhodococcus sp. 1R11]
MTAPDALALAQGQQRLQQERETFDQRKRQDASWFKVRCAIGWVAAVTLPSIMVVACLIIGFHDSFGPTTVSIATGALLVDALATATSLYKIVIGTQGSQPLEPVTAEAPALRTAALPLAATSE